MYYFLIVFFPVKVMHTQSVLFYRHKEIDTLSFCNHSLLCIPHLCLSSTTSSAVLNLFTLFSHPCVSPSEQHFPS